MAEPTRESIAVIVRSALSRAAHVKDFQRLHGGARLYEDLGVSTLQLLHLVFDLEERLGVSLDLETAATLSGREDVTVDDLMAVFATALDAKAVAADIADRRVPETAA